MKKCIFLVATLIIAVMSVAQAQLVVKVNGAAVTEGQVIQATDIAKMEVSYSNLKKISKYPLGRLTFVVQMANKEQGAPIVYKITKTGTNAINAFLGEATGNFLVATKGSSESDFQLTTDTDKDIAKALAKISENARDRSLSVKVALYFQDDTGYEKYGDKVDLATPIKFVINNCNTDGSMNITNGGGIRVPSALIEEVNYFSSFEEKEYFKLKNDYITHTDVAHVCLKKADAEYDRVRIYSVDTKGKTQDEVLNALKTKLDMAMLRSSNACNKSVQTKIGAMTSGEEDQWMRFFTEGKNYVNAPAFSKEASKDWDKTKPLQPFTLGKLSGFKFSSAFRNSNCKEAIEKRAYEGHATLYIAKHPTNPKLVLVIFNISAERGESPENTKKVETKVEKLLSGLEF